MPRIARHRPSSRLALDHHRPLRSEARPSTPALSALRLLLTALPLVLAGAIPVRSQIVIDDFTDAVPQTAQPDIEVAAAVVGGFRDVRCNNASNTATADAGRFRCAGTAAFQGCTVQYDGFDGDPYNFTPGGFVATDFTVGGQDRIVVSTFVAAGTCNLFVQICDDDTPVPQCESMSFPAIADGGTATLEFAAFDPGLDFTAITALQFNLTPTASPLDCSIGPLATSGPLFADGFENGTTSAWSATVP